MLCEIISNEQPFGKMPDSFRQLWVLFEIWKWWSRHLIEDSEYERPDPMQFEFEVRVSNVKYKTHQS